MDLNNRFGKPFNISQQPNSLPKDSLNKYKKREQKFDLSKNYSKQSNRNTSKNQFSKYLLEAKNVFYEDRQTLKQLQSNKKKFIVLTIFWFILASIYFGASKIKPFQGQCPQNATCKVFIRCNPGYELSDNEKSCNVKKSIIDHIENVCIFEITSLRLKYGDSDCNKNISSSIAPIKHVNQLVQNIAKTLDSGLKYQVQRKIKQFLGNQTNKQKYRYEYIKNEVIPTEKAYSFSCWFQIASETIQFKVSVGVFIVFFIIAVFGIKYFLKQKKVKDIFQYLKLKVAEENQVNITLLNDQMKRIYGKIDEEIWIQIDQQRKKEGTIGYYEDQFLFWKAL